MKRVAKIHTGKHVFAVEIHWDVRGHLCIFIRRAVEYPIVSLPSLHTEEIHYIARIISQANQKQSSPVLLCESRIRPFAFGLDPLEVPVIRLEGQELAIPRLVLCSLELFRLIDQDCIVAQRSRGPLPVAGVRIPYIRKQFFTVPKQDEIQHIGMCMTELIVRIMQVRLKLMRVLSKTKPTVSSTCEQDRFGFVRNGSKVEQDTCSARVTIYIVIF